MSDPAVTARAEHAGPGPVSPPASTGPASPADAGSTGSTATSGPVAGTAPDMPTDPIVGGHGGETVLRIVTYNLHGLRDDRHALLAVLRDLRPDVLIAQEAPKRFRWRPVCADLLHAAGLYYVVGGGGGAAGNLLGVSARLRSDATMVRRLPTPVLGQGRGLVGAVLSLGSARLAVVGTHGDLDAERRRSHTDLVLTAAGEFAAEQAAPLVLGADINERPGGPCWQAFERAGLVDAAAGTGLTFPAGAPEHRIDVVFADPALSVVGHAVGAAALTEPALAGRLAEASDHLPVLVELTLA